MVPYASGSEEGGDARTAGANALGQRALGHQFQLQLARQHQALKQLVLADVGADHFFTWRFCSSTPRPKSSTPALLLMMVRSLVPCARWR